MMRHSIVDESPAYRGTNMKLSLSLRLAAALSLLGIFGATAHAGATTLSLKPPRTTVQSKPHPDKPAAPVEIVLRTVDSPVRGEPIDVDVEITPRVAVSGIELRVLPSKGLQLGGADLQVLRGAAAGETITTSFSVTPNSGGTLRVGVLVTLDSTTGRQTRPHLLRLQVKGPVTAVSAKPDTRLETESDGQRVVVFRGY